MAPAGGGDRGAGAGLRATVELTRRKMQQKSKIFIASISATFFDPKFIAERTEQGFFICRSAARHTITVKLPLTGDDGQAKEVEIRVVYRELSLHERVENQRRLESATKQGATLATILADEVVALPDVFDGETPVEPTVEFFSALDLFVLNRINQAIAADRDRNVLVHFVHFARIYSRYTEEEARQEAMHFAETRWPAEAGFTNHTVILHEIPRSKLVEAQVFMSLKEFFRGLLRLAGFLRA